MSITREGFNKHKDVILAWADGAEVELKNQATGGPDWLKDVRPIWSGSEEYRIKATPDSIDWSHVHPDYKWLARDERGMAGLYKEEPFAEPHVGKWDSLNPDPLYCVQEVFTSYKQGTCDWKDSLVSRAQCEASNVALAV